MKYLPLVIMVTFAYLIGNISPATLIGRFYGIDIKKAGSGNAGTTNVLRVLGTKAAICTLLIDVFKGFIAVHIAQGRFNNLGAMLAFAAVVIGHIYPVVFKFKGGKGVATFLGAAMALNWPSNANSCCCCSGIEKDVTWVNNCSDDISILDALLLSKSVTDCNPDDIYNLIHSSWKY